MLEHNRGLLQLSYETYKFTLWAKCTNFEAVGTYSNHFALKR
jgi:hypothetical protein